MGMLDRWNLGAKALGVMRWAADVARSIDPEAALRLAWKVVEIERERRGEPGAGARPGGTHRAAPGLLPWRMPR